MSQVDGSGNSKRTTDDHQAPATTKNVTSTTTATRTIAGQSVSIIKPVGGCQVRWPDGGFTTTDGA